MSLRLKVILVLLAATLAVNAFTFGVWQPWYLRGAIEREARGQSSHLETLGEAVVPFLVQNQIGAVYEAFDAAMARSPSWLGLTLTDPSGQRIYPLGGVTSAGPVADGLRLLHYELSARELPLGRLELVVDFSDRRDMYARQGYLIAGFFTVGSLLAAALIALLLEIIVGRRASALIQAAGDIAHGHFGTRLPAASTDEFGRLTLALEKMREAIAAEEDSLRRARDQADASNRAKSVFLATMSHEIRTPLNGVLGMAELMLDPASSERDRQQYAQSILRSGQTLLTLLNDILDLSRVEAGKLVMTRQPFNPRELVDEIAGLYIEMARGQNIALRADWQGPARSIYRADPVRLRQMLSNLVSNAIKFTPSGEVAISGRELKQDDGEAWLEFSVRDTGIGIEQDLLPAIFEPFSQVDGSDARKFAGSGLGLSLVRGMALAMGGDIGVESSPQQGSTFWFRIPVERHEAAQADAQGLDSSRQTPADQDGQSTAGRHVLVVEDNETNRFVVKAMLGKLSIRVTEVSDGSQALAALANGHQFDLVLMDCQMPVMDGFQTTAALRELEQERQWPRLPVVALTAGAFETDRERCLASGMDDFVTKPITRAVLRETLNKWLPVSGGRG
jgi:signal transduction histidine kinase/ActR/RegA family two-component response regulator